MDTLLPERLGPEEYRKLSDDVHVSAHHTVLTPGLQDVRAKFLNAKHRFKFATRIFPIATLETDPSF